MVECPFCGVQIDVRGRENWTTCPACGNWIERQVNPNGIVYFQTGMLINRVVRAVQLLPQDGQAVRAPNPGPTPVPRRTLPNVNQMENLASVRAQRQENNARLRQLGLDIQRLNNLLTQNRQNAQLTQRYSAERSRYTAEQTERRQYAEQLNAREFAIQSAQAGRSVPTPPRSGSSRAFIGGTILTAASIFAFTRMINLHLDPRAYMVLFLIATGGRCADMGGGAVRVREERVQIVR